MDIDLAQYMVYSNSIYDLENGKDTVKQKLIAISR